MPEDARYRTKVYLETYLLNANLTKDDGTTQVTFIVAFSDPDYPLIRVFNDKAVDLVFCIDDSSTDPEMDSDHYVIGYNEHVSIIPSCINKIGISGVTLLHKTRTELRRVSETYPFGSLREPTSEKPETERLGSTTLYKLRFSLDYLRNLT